MILPLFNGAKQNASILRIFLVILGLMESCMRSMASLGVNEIGYSDRLGLGMNLGPPQPDFNHFLRC